MFSKQNSNLILLGVFAQLFIFASPSVHASSCCAGSGGQSICVLPSEQRYQLGITNTYRLIEGEFDPYGNYTKYQNGTSSRQLLTVIGGAYRLSDDWQAGVSVPLTTNQQTISGTNHSATQLGDPALEARYGLWDDLAFLWYRPQLTFYGGVRVPLGRSVYDSTDPYSVDAVGDGTTTFHAGFNAAKLFRPVKFTLDGTFFYPLSRRVDKMKGSSIANPYDLKTGNRFQLVESASYLFNEHWSCTGGLRQLWVLQSVIDGNSVDGSAQRLFSTLASVNYFYDASWGVGLSYETAFPFYQYIANQPYAQAVALAVTYGGI